MAWPRPRSAADVDLNQIRRLATRRRLSGSKVRRLLPGVVAGSATLAGSGALIAWVGDQPGLITNTSTTATAPSTKPSTTTSLGPQTVSSLTKQLEADESEVQSLDQALGAMAKEEAAASAEGGSTSPSATGSSPMGAVTNGAAANASPNAGRVGAIGPLPTIPPIRSLTITPAPAAPAPGTNSTTGASHAVK